MSLNHPLTAAKQLAQQKAERRAAVARKPKITWQCDLARLRIEHGLSQRDVAAATGLTSGTICWMEKGVDPQLSNAIKIAGFFGCHITDIWQPIRTDKS